VENLGVFFFIKKIKKSRKLLAGAARHTRSINTQVQLSQQQGASGRGHTLDARVLEASKGAEVRQGDRREIAVFLQ
jgi:hypothetical protein